MENKYPKIQHVGSSETEGIFLDKVVIQEKLDGANLSFYLQDGRFIFRSRNHDLSKEEENKEPWVRAVKFVYQKYNEAPHRFVSDLIYFAELMVKHTLNYDWERTPVIIGFDILSKETGKFFHYTKAKEEFARVGIPFVKIIFEKEGQHVKISELQELVDMLKSEFGPEAEGIIVKNYFRNNKYDRPLFGKIVKSSFKERNRLAFTDIKELRDTERRVVQEFCTPARVRKIILKLTVEEGHELHMKMMPLLFKRVSDDILTEEILTIQQKYSSIQFKEFTNMCAAACARELKAYLAEQAK